MEAVEIPLSRRKNFLNIGLLLSIICLGVFLVYISSTPKITLYSIPTFVVGVSLVAVLVFTVVQCVKWIIGNKVGLRVDKTGITDNSSALRIGFIPWNDIVSIAIVQENKIQMILLFVKNTNSYLSQAGRIKRIAMNANDDRYDTPFVLTTTSLDCTFSELEEAIKSCFDEANGRK